VSAILVDSSKDALYAELSGSQRRQAAELAAWDVLRGVTMMAFPIVPFTAEEVFQTSVPTLLLQQGAEYDAVIQGGRDLVRHPLAPHAVLMDAVDGGEPGGAWEQFVPSGWADERMESEAQWGGVEQLRSMVGKASDRARQDGWLRGELEAKAVICVAQGSDAEQCVDWATDRGLWGALRGSEQHDPLGVSQLCDTLRVSAVEIHRVPSSQSPYELATLTASKEADPAATVVIASDADSQASAQVAVALVKAPGTKCDRCWKVAPTLHDVPDLDGVAVCGRCMDAMLSRS
jgi:isoleucyl-tRNA synthetase